ncbi:hypothetical protein VaNZ11_012459 [Volvox africanus]|uniref:DUF726 domain-containing protein n=1 Tax=Volvox africanus TaxID=51714 RepID=A0ABQ5SF01_9CHLO|nr:hypothetical protein VaNZ11_012459 [Volvox africanus]
MDLDDGERYAAAALFTLALHTTQVETGVDDIGNCLSACKSAWGCPDEELFDDLICVPEDEPWPGMEVPSGFWGFDCCAPQGLCRRLYHALGITEARWPGLLKMPEVSSATSVHDARVALVRLVRRYGALLDPAIAPLVSRAVSMDLSDVGGGTLGATESIQSKDMLSTPGEKHQHQHQQEEDVFVLMPADDPEANALVRAHGSVDGEFQQGAAASGGRGTSEVGDAEPSSRRWLKQDSETSVSSSPVVARCTAPVSDAAGAATSNERLLQLARGEPGEVDGRKEGDSARDNERSSGDGPPAAGGAAAAATASHEPTHRSVLALYELIGACLRASAAAGDAADEGNNVAAGSRASTEGQKEAPGLEALAPVTAAHGRAEPQQSASVSEGIAHGAEGSPGGSGGEGDGAKGKSGRFSFFSGRLTGSSKGAGATGSGGGGGSDSGKGASSVGAAAAGGTILRVVRTPLVRWYDARARVALRRLCHWLHIPGPKMHAMEQMWALQLLRLRPDGQANVTAGAGPAGTMGNGPRYMAYLKISAGALGGAALLALTGGLAAPAIAAGLGSAIMVFGGSTAAAAAVTTLGGTAAGTAAITGTFGVIGASHAGSKTAALYGEVREFGFWSISAPFILPPPPSAAESPEADRGDSGDCGDGTDTTRANDPSGPSSAVGGSVSRWSSLFRWRTRGGDRTDAPGPLNASGSLPQPQEQENETAEQIDGQRVVMPVPPTCLPPLPLPSPLPRRTEVPKPGNVLQGRPGRTARVAAVPLPGTGTGSDAADLLTTTAVAPSPALARQSRSSSTVSRDGLFIPADLLVEDGVDGNSGGSGAERRMAADLSHPAALFRHAPVTPYPPPPADNDSDALALTLTAVAVQAGDPAAAADQHSGATLASASPTVSSALAAAARSRVASDGGAFGNSGGIREISAHPLYTRSNRSDGGGAPAVDGRSVGATASLRSRSRTTSLGDVAVPNRDGASSVSMLEVREEKSYNRTEGVFCSRAQCAGEQAGDGAGRDAMPAAREWDAELAASDRSAARARLERAGPDGAFVQALLAELDAEAADLDGNNSGCTEPATALAVAATDATSGSCPSSRWSWFRSSNKQPRTTADGEISGSCGATAAAVEGKKWTKWTGKGEQARPLLRVPVDPKRIGESTLALTIAVNGWVKQPEDFVAPWRQLPSSGRELWALVWESDVLQSLDGALRRFIRDKAIEESSKMVLRLGVSTALVTAMMLPMAVMSAINFTLGSCWRLALRRAQLGGRCLAHMLMQGGHGDRPVTLIGFSIGARLIFHCLLELSRCGARGLVESAVLLGTPVSANEARWKQARAAVSGRLVNAFSSNDWVLGVVFRAHSKNSLVQRASGLAPVAVAGIENINLSSLIAGHTQYLEKLEDVLCALNLAEH